MREQADGHREGWGICATTLQITNYEVDLLKPKKGRQALRQVQWLYTWLAPAAYRTRDNGERGRLSFPPPRKGLRFSPLRVDQPIPSLFAAGVEGMFRTHNTPVVLISNKIPPLLSHYRR